MKVELILKDGQIKILIDKIIHISIVRSELVGFQSWHENLDRYYIEFYTKTQDFFTEYYDKTLWIKILKLLNTEIK